jgi:tetratricopeptide (TPR) repeat protein
MIETTDLPIVFPPATAGDIAVINLDSARRQSWSRFWRTPERPGIAETIVEQELLTAQFVGGLAAYDRLDVLVKQLTRAVPEAAQTAIIEAQVACATHRFAEATVSLAQAVARGAPSDAAERLSLSLYQASGKDLHEVLRARRKRAAKPGHWEELVPLGALLADLGEFDEAELTYRRALREYQDVSPFAMAWVCFHLGVLWGEVAPEPQLSRAAQWYQKAVEYLPCYVKARVHLAEIYCRDGRTEDAEALLVPAAPGDDPEVHWRLADVMFVRGDFAAAERYLQVARSGFDELLEKRLLAFADHAAEFYSGSGDDAGRAFELAQVNIMNRPTLAAFQRAYATAVRSGDADGAYRIFEEAKDRWGGALASRLSSLAEYRPDRIASGASRSTVARTTDVRKPIELGKGVYHDVRP